jgi:hypothetical protein
MEMKEIYSSVKLYSIYLYGQKTWRKERLPMKFLLLKYQTFQAVMAVQC